MENLLGSGKEGQLENKPRLILSGLLNLARTVTQCFIRASVVDKE